MVLPECTNTHCAGLSKQCQACLLQLLLVLLVVYAIVVMAALSFVMMLLVHRAATSRLRLFSIFTALPRPTVVALASKSVTVTGGRLFTKIVTRSLLLCSL